MSTLSVEKQQILHLVKTDKDQANYFFARVKSLEWLHILKTQGYFSPNRILFDENNNAQFWIVLSYLERISVQVEQKPEYCKELLDIIESTVQFSKNKKIINNQHIWDSCIKIIGNLPISIIKEHLYIEDTIDANGKTRYGFKAWLEVFTDPSTDETLTAIEIGKNLLKKFLKDDSTIKYAELIIDVLTRYKLVGTEPSSGFDKSDVYMQYDSYCILETFKNNTETISLKCSNSIIYSIADKLKAVLNYKHRGHSNDFRIDQDVYRISTSRRETGEIVNEIPLYEEDKFICSIRKFSADQLKDTDFTRDILVLHDILPEISISEDIHIDADCKDNFIFGLKDKLPKNIDWNNAENFNACLDRLYIALYQDFSQIWLQPLTREPLGTTAKEVLSVILRDILLSKYKADPNGSFEILKNFLSNKYQFSIFKRFPLLCVSKYWDSKCIELLEIFLNITPDILDEFEYEVELFNIIKNHNNEFPEQMRSKILQLISNVPEYYDRYEKQKAERAYKWLSALKDNPDFKGLYNDAKQKARIIEDKPYKPNFGSGVFRVIDKSPIPKDAILNKPILELIKLLKEFQESGSFEEPISKQGLGKELQAAVKENPNHFTDCIKEFHNVPFLYVHCLLEGLIEAWNTNIDIDWEKTLNFALEHISTSYFSKLVQGKQESNPFGDRPSCILDNITRLIKVGSSDDNRAFAPSLFDTVEKIFSTIIPYLKGEDSPKIHIDSITYALNTTLGKTIEAFIYYSLRKTRVNKQPDKNWGKSNYEQFLKLGIEPYIWLGYYLSNIIYLDKEYTDNLLNELLTSTDNNNWKMFMEGYLSNSRMYHNKYNLLRNHYKKAINVGFSRDDIERSLVTHIILAYLYFDESLGEKNSDNQDSLFWILLNSPVNKQKRWEGVASVLRSKANSLQDNEEQDNGEIDHDVNPKIIEFWRWTYDNQDSVKSILKEGYIAFLKKLANLITVLNEIDEEKEKWITLSVSHIDDIYGRDVSFVIECLTKFRDKVSIEHAGKIYLKLLEKITPIYKQEDIETIVRKLYEINSCKDDADTICNTYGRRGYHFLKPLWEEYNKGRLNKVI